MMNLQPNTTLQGGKYRIERLLGQGGFGNTYVGYNTIFDERIAIKEFFMRGVTERDETTCAVSVSNEENVAQFEEQREKFKKEARRLRKLKNEHIVKVHDLFEENGTAYYVMDYIEGDNLAERMKRTGKPFSETEVRNILPQILSALKEVHQNEIWHLDIKPGNIMLDKDGNAYLIDFGASKQIRSNGSITTSTALCYTPGYAPNEQIGQMYDRFGPWTDIYALGATIYTLLTNKRPPMAIDIEEEGDDAFNYPNSVSSQMRELVIWMMKPQRKKRPQNVDEINELQDDIADNVSSKNPDIFSDKADDTILDEKQKVSSSLIVEKVDIKINTPTQNGNEVEESDEDRTRLVITQKGKIVEQEILCNCPNVNRQISVGDYLYDDGYYSDELDNRGKKIVGVLFTKYGGAHGQLFSAELHKDILYINGKELKWHPASIGEWVEIINNIGLCKVSFGNGEYKYYSEFARSNLIKHLITMPRFKTRKSVNGISYLVDLEACLMTPLENELSEYQYIYISDF